jgi:hypothetical protein
MGATVVGTPRPSAVQRALGWSTIVDLETEEGRAFIQDRIAFLGKVAFLLSILSFALTRLAVALDPAAAPPLEARHGSELMAAAAYAYYLLMWLVCRRGRRPRRMLGFLDGAFPIVSTTAASLPLVLWPGEIPGLEWRVLLILTHTLVGRAVFVPSPPLRTLAIGMLAAAPAAAGIWTGEVARGVSAGPASALSLITWALIAIAMAGVTSSVIYGLRRTVHEARRLGQYTLQEKLGEGGMGIVYRAQHAMLRRPTAIKLLPPEKAGDHNLQRFEREVQLTSLLTHPNTVSVFDYGRTPDGILYYAMEYLDGINLDALVKGFGPQEPARVVHILRQVAGSLAEAHGVGLVHRDIKPANIILCQRGGVPDVAKVVDFGLAKDLEAASATALTRATDITGTPLYLAPEAITAPDRLDARGDLYALGAVGYYLLAGVHVFEGATLVELVSHHLRTPPVAPSIRLGRPLPADLEAVLLSCLEKDPARRPQSADALGEHLAMCVGVDEWRESEAREWWARSTERIADLRAGVRPAAMPGRTVSMDLSSRVGWGD